MSKQGGFSHILLVVLIIGIFVAVGFVGWRVFDAQQAEAPTQQSTTTTTVDEPVESAADVSELEGDLDAMPIEEDLDSSALDQDVSDLQ
jgi:predicted negative regulator of RcsB-dependent stress response